MGDIDAERLWGHLGSGRRATAAALTKTTQPTP